LEVKLGAGEAERSDVKLESHSESEGVIIDELMRNGPLRDKSTRYVEIKDFQDLPEPQEYINNSGVQWGGVRSSPSFFSRFFLAI